MTQKKTTKKAVPRKKPSAKKKTAKSKKRTGWRKYGKARIKQAVVGSGGLKTVIAKRLGCSRTTLNKYIEELPDIAEWVGDEDCLLGDTAENQLALQIKEGNLTAIIFYLKTKQQKRGYIEKTQVDNTSSDGSMSADSRAATPEEVASITEEILAKYHGIDEKAC